MTVQRGDFDAIVESDLQELIDGQVTEHVRLDYKRTKYGSSDQDKRELLKDVSALANSHGGHLILGLEETGGVATGLIGLDNTNCDSEILRMEQIVRSGLEPPVSGIRMKAIQLSNGRPVILVRVPRSWNPPHRVVASGVNRFHMRHSTGVYEPSVEELRVLFNQSTTALEHARQFRDERIQAVCAGEGNRPLVAGGRLFLHIVPTAAFSGMVNLDVSEIHTQHQAFRPMGTMGMSPRFNYHGFINERGGESNYGYTQIFRNGCFEATKAGVVRESGEKAFIPSGTLETEIFEVYSPFVEGLRDLGVPPPLIIMVTLEGVRGVSYAVAGNWGDSPLPYDIMRLPECVLEDYGTEVDHHRAVRPAFDALWNAIGYASARSFDEEGRWCGLKS